MQRCFIGLGSNLSNPILQVQQALKALAQLDACSLTTHSSLYRSNPVGPADQPDYINAVAELQTHLAPETLLNALQAIEQAHQRTRKVHWGPRTLDLDLLLYGDKSINTARLTVPHPYLTERAFVLYPLAEIAPNLQLPNLSPLAQLLNECPMGTLAKITV